MKNYTVQFLFEGPNRMTYEAISEDPGSAVWKVIGDLVAPTGKHVAKVMDNDGRITLVKFELVELSTRDEPTVPDALPDLEQCDNCSFESDSMTEFMGMKLCAACAKEYIPEESEATVDATVQPDEPPDEPPVEPGYLRYRISYGDAFKCKMDARSPTEAMNIAEQACLRRRGADFLAEWHARGELPSCEVIARPRNPELPDGVSVTPPPVVDQASIQHDYNVTIYLGSETIVAAVEAPSAQVACSLAAQQYVQQIVDIIGRSHGDIPMMAVRSGNPDDKWGIGPVRLPLERVVSFAEMGIEGQARARKLLGIETFDAPPPMLLGGITSAHGEPSEAEHVG